MHKFSLLNLPLFKSAISAENKIFVVISVFLRFKFIFPLSFDNFFLSNLLHDVIIVNNIFATVSRSFFEKSFLKKKKIIVTRHRFFQDKISRDKIARGSVISEMSLDGRSFVSGPRVNARWVK